MAKCVLRIEGLAAANYATPLDGRYVVALEWPTPAAADAMAVAAGVDTMVGNAPSTSGPCPLVLRTTTDPAAAAHFGSFGEAMELWRTVAPAPHQRRLPDGKPNRPLTAYTVTVLPL